MILSLTIVLWSMLNVEHNFSDERYNLTIELIMLWWGGLASLLFQQIPS
jgi:hypothetical protein